MHAHLHAHHKVHASTVRKLCGGVYELDCEQKKTVDQILYMTAPVIELNKQSTARRVHTVLRVNKRAISSYCPLAPPIRCLHLHAPRGSNDVAAAECGVVINLS